MCPCVHGPCPVAGAATRIGSRATCSLSLPAQSRLLALRAEAHRLPTQPRRRRCSRGCSNGIRCFGLGCTSSGVNTKSLLLKRKTRQLYVLSTLSPSHKQLTPTSGPKASRFPSLPKPHPMLIPSYPAIPMPDPLLFLSNLPLAPPSRDGDPFPNHSPAVTIPARPHGCRTSLVELLPPPTSPDLARIEMPRGHSQTIVRHCAASTRSGRDHVDPSPVAWLFSDRSDPPRFLSFLP